MRDEPALLERYMQIAKDLKKELVYSKHEGVWRWEDRDGDTSGEVFPTFWACLCDVVEPYVESQPPHPLEQLGECAPEEPAALVRDPNKDGDFTLVGQSAWITAGGVSAHIRRDEQGVAVALYLKGEEDQDELARCHAEFDGA